MSLYECVVILAGAVVIVAMLGEVSSSSLLVLGGMILPRMLESVRCLINCEDEVMITNYKL
jgi:hypothetical protein